MCHVIDKGKVLVAKSAPVIPSAGRYSNLKACTGSMDAARRAGMIPAMNAARAMITIAPAITLKSALVISIKLRFHKSHAEQRDRDSDRQPKRGLNHRSPHHHRNHAAALRTERHTNPDLRSPPHYGIGRHAVQPDDRQQQRQRAKQRRQSRDHPLLG